MAASRGMLSRIPHKAHGVVAADRGHHASVRLKATAPQVRGPGRSRQWAGIRRVADVPQPQERVPADARDGPAVRAVRHTRRAVTGCDADAARVIAVVNSPTATG